MQEYEITHDLVLIHDEADNELPLAIDIGSDCFWMSTSQFDNMVEKANAALGRSNPSDDGVIKASDVSLNEGLLRLAAVHRRTATFRYAKSSSAPIEFRSFIPEDVRTTTAGHVIVVGPDEDRDGEYRSYRLDRIKGEVSLP